MQGDVKAPPTGPSHPSRSAVRRRHQRVGGAGCARQLLVLLVIAALGTGLLQSLSQRRILHAAMAVGIGQPFAATSGLLGTPDSIVAPGKDLGLQGGYYPYRSDVPHYDGPTYLYHFWDYCLSIYTASDGVVRAYDIWQT